MQYQDIFSVFVFIFLTTEGCGSRGQGRESRAGGRGWQRLVNGLDAKKSLWKWCQTHSLSVERRTVALAVPEVVFSIGVAPLGRMEQV